MWQCGEFNQQKIIVQHKGKSDDQVAFAKSLKEIFVRLEAFIKENHRTGLEWNPKGVALADAKAAAGGGGPAPPPLAPPPPAPPGGAPPPPPTAAAAAAAAAGRRLRRRRRRRRRDERGLRAAEPGRRGDVGAQEGEEGRGDQGPPDPGGEEEGGRRARRAQVRRRRRAGEAAEARPRGQEVDRRVPEGQLGPRDHRGPGVLLRLPPRRRARPAACRAPRPAPRPPTALTARPPLPRSAR